MEYVEDNARAFNEFARIAKNMIWVVAKGKLTVNSQLREYSEQTVVDLVKPVAKEYVVDEVGPMIVSTVKF
jgi:hypothetical protein